jgi:hypothetical protein
MSKYLAASSILLISSRSGHRSGLRKILFDNGASNNMIEVASDMEQVKDRFTQKPFNIIIADDDIGEHKDLIGLLMLHEQNNPKSSQRLFVLMAGEVTNLFRSEFLMKGGDLIIDKPYTSGTFLTAFKKILDFKEKLTQDDVIALDVEDALKKKDKSKALNFLATFKTEKSQPWYFSKGIINKYDNEFFEAYKNFTLSIEQKIDLKSLVNVFNTGIKSKKYRELEPLVQVWIKNFPLYEGSIADIARVAVYNKKFEYLNQMEVEEQHARIPMAAGMVVASSFFLDGGDQKKSIEYAKKAIEYSGFKKSILRRGLEILVEAGALLEAQKIFENPKLQASLSDDPTFFKGLKTLLQI